MPKPGPRPTTCPRLDRFQRGGKLRAESETGESLLEDTGWERRRFQAQPCEAKGLKGIWLPRRAQKAELQVPAPS